MGLYKIHVNQKKGKMTTNYEHDETSGFFSWGGRHSTVSLSQHSLLMKKDQILNKTHTLLLTKDYISIKNVLS